MYSVMEKANFMGLIQGFKPSNVRGSNGKLTMHISRATAHNHPTVERTGSAS